MVGNMKISHTKSTTKGVRISVYLRREHFETLMLLEKALNKNRSETIQHLLEVIRNWIKAIMEEKPEFIMSLIQEEMRKLIIPEN